MIWLKTNKMLKNDPTFGILQTSISEGPFIAR